ncbi:MAG: hypothetical protein QOF58_376, partial [Pseudonocardiales bacterium]|nr:hypothetical protein [Pseudonocardiales bacterium]
MRVVALAACVAAAVALSFFMREDVPPWTVLACVVVFVASFLLGRRMAPGWPAIVFAAGFIGLTPLVVVGLSAALPWFLGRV